MIAVVTGSSGFIGRNLVDRLLRDGHTARCLVRPGGGPAPSGAESYPADLRSTGDLERSPAFESADIVFHVGGVTRAVRPGDFHAANVDPTRAILATLVARRSEARFVYVSSQAAAGPAPSPERPITEDDPPAPVEAYGRSKLAAEEVVRAFANRVRWTIVRPCAVYGRHDRDFRRLFLLARRGVLVYPAVRDHWLSLLHVDDVVEGLLQAATRPAAVGRTYFLASSRPVRWREVGSAVAAAVGRSAQEVDVPRPLMEAIGTAGDLAGRLMGRTFLASREKVALSRFPYWVCSAERAERELGVRQRVALPEGIRETYLWYEAHDPARRSIHFPTR